tara:strand:- start:833 stop:1327 length:495 start_codon:yes stop_codon:yes gene_type:complete
MNIKDKLDFLQIQEVTTKRQKANGTREFKLPVNDPYGDAIHVASYSTGYVRRTKTTGRSDWQLNKTRKSKRYVNMNDEDNGRPVIRTFESIERVLIHDEQERLEYLISYCLKNYYIGQSNMLSNGNYIPKWKYDDLQKSKKIGWNYGNQDEISVTINGHRYNIT